MPPLLILISVDRLLLKVDCASELLLKNVSGKCVHTQTENSLLVIVTRKPSVISR